MIKGKYHFEKGCIIIDAAEIEPGKYEIMKLSKRTGREIESYTVYDLCLCNSLIAF